MFNYKRIFLILITIMCISCGTTKIIEVPIETIKTEHSKEIVHDSIFMNTTTETSIRSDTVFKTIIQYKYKYKYLKDTICIRDTIPKLIKVKEVEYVNKLTQTQKTFYWIGVIITLILIPTVIYKIKSFKL